MPEPIHEQSPLWRVNACGASSSIARAGAILYWENALQGHINLRGDPADAAFALPVAGALGAALPLAPNTTSAAGDVTAYWLGPDEWLIVTPGERERDVAEALRTALAGVHSSVTEVSGGQTILALRGAHVRDLLAKGCPLDLHPAAFAPGACAQTHLAKAAVLLRPLEGDAMELIFRRSFADYLWTWIETAATEYGLVPSAEALPPRANARPTGRATTEAA